MAYAMVLADTTKNLEKSLEMDYKQRMGEHLKHRDKRHRGLGYHGESTSSLEKEEDPTPTPQPTTESKRAEHSHDVTQDGQVHFVSEDGEKHVDL